MRLRLRLLVRIAITAGILTLLVIFARTVDWRQTWAAIRGASLGVLLAATLVNLLSLATKGVRWWLFLRRVGSPSLWLAIRATVAGAGLNNILVANGGEAARVIFVARTAHVKSAPVLATLALERLFELIGYIVLASMAVTFLDVPQVIARVRPLALGGLVLVLVFSLYLVQRRPGHEPRERTGTGWLRGVRAYGGHFMHTLAGISTGPRFGAALLLSVAGWALQVATYQLTADAAGFPLPVVGTVAALIAVNLGFALRATPGNVGLFQVVYALVAVAFGLDKDRAIGVAFLIQTQQILPVTALGVLFAPEFIFKRRRTPRPENILPGEPVLAVSEGRASVGPGDDAT